MITIHEEHKEHEWHYRSAGIQPARCVRELAGRVITIHERHKERADGIGVIGARIFSPRDVRARAEDVVHCCSAGFSARAALVRKKRLDSRSPVAQTEVRAFERVARFHWDGSK